MSDYGSPEYGGRKYGGALDPFSSSAVPVIVEIYDNNGTYKGVFQTGVGDFTGVEFTIDESRSRDFILFFADFADIEKKDIIKIKLFGSDDNFFTGVVRQIPIDGSTEASYNYSGFGMIDYLIRANTESQSYAAKTINFIVNDLLDNIITQKTPIVKNDDKIGGLTVTVTAIDFKYISCLEAMRQLKDLAQSDGNEYIVGVDEEGEFFFKQRSDETIVTLVTGKLGNRGIPRYEPEDSIEEKSKFFVLNNDGTFIGTVSSTEDIDIFEAKLTAPDIDNADVLNWANGKLLIAEEVTREAVIEWELEKWNPILLKGDGNVRIISNIPPTSRTVSGQTAYGAGLYGAGLYGGGPLYSGKDIDDLLKVKEIKYIINSGKGVREIQLGSIPAKMSKAIIDVNQNIQDLRVSIGR
jgi:hypothetical protein